MGSAIGSGRLRWAWMGLLVPPLVLVGTYSDSVLAPLGWITAFIVLCLWAFLMARTAVGTLSAHGSSSALQPLGGHSRPHGRSSYRDAWLGNPTSRSEPPVRASLGYPLSRPLRALVCT